MNKGGDQMIQKCNRWKTDILQHLCCYFGCKSKNVLETQLGWRNSVTMPFTSIKSKITKSKMQTK